MTTPPGAYRGSDRRVREVPVAVDRRASGRPPRADGGRVLVLFGSTLVLALVAPAAAGTLLSTVALGQLRTGLTSLSTALLVAAALSYLLRWRLSGEAPVALVGIALMVFGVANGLLAPFGPLLIGVDPSPLRSSPTIRSVAGLVAVVLLLRSLRSPVVLSRFRPLRSLAWSATAVSLLVAGGGALVQGSAALTPRSMHAGMGVVWLLTAVLFVRRAAGRLQADLLWIGLALGCVSLSTSVRALADGRSAAGLAAAAAIDAVAAGVALLGTTRHLSSLLVVQGSERARMHAVLLDDQAAREERLHDVRSTLAAIRCAAGTLNRYDERLRAEQRASLQSAVAAELVRLERLIDPAETEQSRTFDLGRVLAAVVETERARGLQVSAQLDGVLVRGRPDDTAAIVQNLLSNAGRYAPGTPVVVDARVRGDRVEVRVSDRGCGLAADECEAVFDRGRRGSAGRDVSGSGLGLYVSRRLAREQGGDLRAEVRSGGGARFVLDLPAGPVPVPATARQERARLAFG